MPYLSSPGARITGMLSEQSTLVRLILALIAAAGALYIGEVIYLGEYLTTDENSYMFQAWIFLQGKFSLPCPPLEEAFFHRMIICDDQVGWVSRYPPAHSVWLMPGIALGYPRLMTAVAAFLSVWFLTGASERLKIPAWITGLLLLISPYFWLMQGSVLSHTSGLATTAIMLWAYLVWLQDRKVVFAVIAGLAWAFLFLNRSYTALWIALPFGLDALLRLAQHRKQPDFGRLFKGTFLFATSSSLGIVLYFYYNHIITGDAFTTTFLHYDPTEGPGFGKVRGGEHTPAMGWGFLKYNIKALNVNLWGFSGSLLLWLALALIGWRKGITPLLLSCTFLVWIAYSAFWFRGILEVPPIYYYETLVFVILLAAMGLQKLFRASWPTPRWGKLLVACLLITSVAFMAIKTFKTNAQVVTKRTAYTHAFQQVIRDVPAESIVVLQGLHKDILAQNSWNPHGIDSEPLILRNVNGVLQVIPTLFPDRPVYRVSGWKPGAAERIQNLDQFVRTIYATRMRFSTGNREEDKLIARAREHTAGLLGYAVKQYLVPGLYEATFRLNAVGEPGEIIGRAEVKINTRRVPVIREINDGDETIVLNFEASDISLAEPRIHYSGKGRLELERIEIRLLEPKLLK